MESYNRILLVQPPFFRKVSEHEHARDASSLIFILDELISYGVVDIAISALSLSTMALDTLPESLRKRVAVIDKKGRVRKKSRSIYTPILQEFGLQEYQDGAIVGRTKNGRKLERVLLCLVSRLYPFLLGLEYKLQIDLDIDAMKDSLGIIRERSKDPISRASLSTLSGIFSTYVPQNVRAIKLHSKAPERLVEIFEQFVADADYRNISTQFHSIGFPDKVRSSISRIGTLSKNILTKPPFKNIANIASKCITAATQIPVPVSDLGEALAQHKYFPPIVSLKEALEKAHSTWEKARTEHISLMKSGRS